MVCTVSIHGANCANTENKVNPNKQSAQSKAVLKRKKFRKSRFEAKRPDDLNFLTSVIFFFNRNRLI